eukprot:scaffold69829_cov69-Phaeocystis_antarctica.AAC.6
MGCDDVAATAAAAAAAVAAAAGEAVAMGARRGHACGAASHTSGRSSSGPRLRSPLPRSRRNLCTSSCRGACPTSNTHRAAACAIRHTSKRVRLAPMFAAHGMITT